MQFVDLWMQSIGSAIYYLLSYLSKIIRTKEIWIGNYFMVLLFLQFIFFPQWSTAVLCVSTSQPFIVQGPSTLVKNHPGTVLYSPVTVVSIYYHVRFGSAENSHVLVLFFLYLFCLPAEWECVFSVGFLVPSSFWGFGYPVTVWQSVCRPLVVHGPWVEEHCLTSLTKASPKHKDFHQFSLPENIFPQPVFSLHLPHLHIALLLSLLLNCIRNNPLLGTNTLVRVLFHLSCVG